MTYELGDHTLLRLIAADENPDAGHRADLARARAPHRPPLAGPSLLAHNDLQMTTSDCHVLNTADVVFEAPSAR